MVHHIMCRTEKSACEKCLKAQAEALKNDKLCLLSIYLGHESGGF